LLHTDDRPPGRTGSLGCREAEVQALIFALFSMEGEGEGENKLTFIWARLHISAILQLRERQMLPKPCTRIF
jgi:hypothetical protein